MSATPRKRSPAKAAPKPRSSARRGSNGRFAPRAKASRQRSTAAIGVAAGLGVVAAGVAAVLRFGLIDRLRPTGNAEHAAPDLALDRPHPSADSRAPDAFRPDPTAPVTAAERDGLRPAPLVPTGFTEETRSETLQ